MTMITPSYLGETIEYSSLHACRSTLEDPTCAAGFATPGALVAHPAPTLWRRRRRCRGGRHLVGGRVGGCVGGGAAGQHAHHNQHSGDEELHEPRCTHGVSSAGVGLRPSPKTETALAAACQLPCSQRLARRSQQSRRLKTCGTHERANAGRRAQEMFGAAACASCRVRRPRPEIRSQRDRGSPGPGTR